MQSHARLDVEYVGESARGTGRSRVRRQRSQGALVLRPTIDAPPAWAQAWGLRRRSIAAVRLVAGAAGPIGGDSWRLDIDVADGTTLLLSAAAGTLILPGPRGEASRSDVNIRVGAQATVIFEPGVQIAAAGCRHVTCNRIELAAGARLFLREEVVLGRHGEAPGRFAQRLRVIRDGRPLHDQELCVGDQVPGWNGPAVMGGRRALGSLLLVDPEGAVVAREPSHVVEGLGDTAVMPLAGPGGLLVSSIDRDSVGLRRKLDAAFDAARRVGGPARTASPDERPYTVKRVAQPQA